MSNFHHFPPLAAAFFQPRATLLPGLLHQRSCPELPDAAWLALGISRVLENEPSGRAFLQKAAGSLLTVPCRSSFIEVLASPRRLLFCQAANEALARFMTRTLPDPFAAFPSLNAFDLHAGGGHFHAAAVHDPRSEPGAPRYATGGIIPSKTKSARVPSARKTLGFVRPPAGSGLMVDGWEPRGRPMSPGGAGRGH